MRDLEATVEGVLEAWPGAGLGVVVVADGRIVLEQGFGKRSLDGSSGVTADTLFAIGSTTKAFASAVVGALVDDGVLDWDEPVTSYLPGFRMHDPVATAGMTPRDLLCHRCGLPRHDSLWYGNEGLSRAELVGRLRHLQPNRGFRETFQYNNLMFITAGHLVEEVTGETWESQVSKRLFEPLGMARANFSVDVSQADDDHATPQVERAGELLEVPFRQIDLTGPAGCINASTRDMGRWLLANIAGGSLDGARVLSATTAQELHKLHTPMPDTSAVPELESLGYGLGWFLSLYRGHRMVHHGGNIDGFTANVAFIPAAGVGVVALCNRGASSLPKAVTHAVLDELLELPSLDWATRNRQAEQAQHRAAEALEERRQGGRKGAARGVGPGHSLADYAGVFVHPGYGELTFTHDGQELSADLHGLPYEVQHRHYEVFDLFDERRAAPLPVTFTTDVDGRVDEVRVPLEASLPAMVFRRRAPAADPAVVARAIGEYALGATRVAIEGREGGRLTLALPMSGTHVLETVEANVFRAPTLPGATVTFEIEGDVAVRLVLNPGGVLERVPGEGV